MTVDLSQYLDQEVEVTYENGCRRIGKVKKVPKVGLNTVEYSLRWHSDLGGASYTKDGFYWSNKSPFSLNIVKIKPIKMKKYEQLENQIKELQAEVERLKKEEEKTKLPKEFSRKDAIAFLEEPDGTSRNKAKSLYNAFVWTSTPQCESYWHQIQISLINNSSYKVPQEAIMAIQSWVIESYKEQYGV